MVPNQKPRSSTFFGTAIKYGAAWTITTQLLGTVTYILVYFALLFTNTDGATLTQWIGPYLPPSALAQIAPYLTTDTGAVFGRLTLAYFVNRLLSPIRLPIVLAIVPFVAEPLNQWYARTIGARWSRWWSVKKSDGSSNDEAADGERDRLTATKLEKTS
ncbi:hypothetical protein BJ742DRAFT_810411 [Cladochytrium replicatum]|nr:hypothetical protein BJ742DRAFT_810411 [Cladochytrium replicatum]